MMNEQLRSSLLDQLERLVRQLHELEECKRDFDADEYEQLHADTIQQLSELQNSLTKLDTGNIGLHDDLSLYRAAITAAIRNAFHTPEVLRMFINRQPAQIRSRIEELKRDFKLNKSSTPITEQQYSARMLELLHALVQLQPEAELSIDERQLLDFNKLQNILPKGVTGEWQALPPASTTITSSSIIDRQKLSDLASNKRV